MPFHEADNPYTVSARYIDILSDVMSTEVEFFRMTPQDHLLTGHDPFRVWCLAESGRQYLVFSIGGEAFDLHVAPGEYVRNVWIDTKTGRQQLAPALRVSSDEAASEKSAIMPDERRIGTLSWSFNPPDHQTDWVLMLRTSK
jgi:hypothetical protein